MNSTSITSTAIDQADEDILTAIASDEALEAAAGTESAARWPTPSQSIPVVSTCLD